MKNINTNVFESSKLLFSSFLQFQGKFVRVPRYLKIP